MVIKMKLKELKYMPVKGEEWKKFEDYENSENGRIGEYVVKRASGLKKGFSNFNLSFNDNDYIEEAKSVQKTPRELAIEDAQFHAKFYQSLVNERIYHPDTQFCICADEEGYPTLLAIMPFMKKIDRIYPKMEDYQSKRGDYRKKRKEIDDIYPELEDTINQNENWFVEKYEICPFPDFMMESNYGKSDEGNYYWFDLHLFHTSDNHDNHIRIPKELREKLESLKYEKGGKI